MIQIFPADLRVARVHRHLPLRRYASSYVGSLLVLSGFLTGVLALCVAISLARLL